MRQLNGAWRQRLGGMGYLAALMALLWAIALAGPAARAALAFDKSAILDGEIFRILTGHFVQLNQQHLEMNTAGLLLVVFVLLEVLSWRPLLLATMTAALGVSAGLLAFSEGLGTYYGFSGITHGLITWGGIALLRQGRPAYGALVLTVLTGKTVWEQLSGPLPGAEEAVGGRISTISHLGGAIGGIAAALATNIRLSHAGKGAVAFAVALLVTFAGREATAHQTGPTEAIVERTSTGEIMVTIRTHVAAFALRQPLRALDDEQRRILAEMSDEDLADYLDGSAAFILSRARLILADSTDVVADRIGAPKASIVRHHELSATPGAAPHYLLVFPAVALSEDAQVQLVLPRMLGTVQLILRHDTGSPTITSVFPGLPSNPFSLAAPRGWVERTAGYIKQGITHVVPDGWDHTLFIAGIGLALSSIWPAVLQATVFTLAHSLTLVLTVLGVISPPAVIVELWIAVSIAFMALANLVALYRHQEEGAPSKKRLALIFGFGLVHGMGFATVFSSIMLEPADLVLALASFNIGVEIGQIIVLIAVISLVTLLRWRGIMGEHGAVAARVAKFTANTAIAAFGIYWTVNRFGDVM